MIVVVGAATVLVTLGTGNLEEQKVWAGAKADRSDARAPTMPEHLAVEADTEIE